jgi:hypothetical protein
MAKERRVDAVDFERVFHQMNERARANKKEQPPPNKPTREQRKQCIRGHARGPENFWPSGGCKKCFAILRDLRALKVKERTVLVP